MVELMKKVIDIPGVYDGFILGVVNYAKRKPEHVKVLNDFIDEHPDATTSEVVEFMIQQPDFHTYSAVQPQLG